MARKDSAKGATALGIIVRHLFTTFNAFNFTIGACIAAVGEYKDLLYLVVNYANTLIGIIQDIRSKRIVDKLSLLTAPTVSVMRNNTVQHIRPEELTQGDRFCLKRGNQVCADATVKSGCITVNEALLTGEAVPIEKHIGDALLSGSFVTAGLCEATADKVGEDCYAAGIARQAKKSKKNDSMILASLNKIVRFTGLFIIPLGAVLFYESYIAGGVALASSVTTTAAALLGLLPKGLVLLTSVSLAVGVIRLGKRNALVQELFGIEALARVDVLCMDKTGTLTNGELEFDGFIPLEDASNRDELTALFCHAFGEDGSPVLDALKRQFPDAPKTLPQTVTPFSSERAWSAVEYGGGSLYMGAAERLMNVIPESIRKAEQGGAHVLVFACSKHGCCETLPDDLIPLYAVCLRDAIRPEAAEVLRYFEKQDVRLMIFSGDSVSTTSAIANRAGLSGKAVDAGSLVCDADYDAAVLQCSAFGRVLPEQKLALVKALQRQGHTVGMLGDGVNDVLAIRQADCGIAMASGCDAARRVARLVLMGNSFSALPKVVSEGRRVVNNIRRVASFFLTKTCFSFLLSLICALTGMQYPFEPLQLSIYSILFEALPALILTFRPNAARISGDIVKDAIRRALPYSIAITAGVMLIRFASAGLAGFETASTWTAFAWMCCIGAVLVARVVLERRTI